MKNYSTSQLMLMGLAFSFLGVVSLTLLPLVVNFNLALSATIVFLTLTYMATFISSSEAKVGRVSMLLAYVVLSLVLFLFDASIDWFIFSALTLIWFVRMTFGQTSFFNACYSALLLGGGFSAASAVLYATHSWFLAFWCFFLTQALFSLKPDLLIGDTKLATHSGNQSSSSTFQSAFQSANSALSKLSQN